MLPSILAKVSQVQGVAALRYRNFRYFFLGSLLASSAKWMETVILSWLALEMTGSPFKVGAVAASRWVGYALGPIFGALADRYNRRWLIISITSVGVLYSATLAILVTTEVVQYWQLVIIGVIAGVAHAFDLPLRYTLTGDLVDKRDLTNAVSLGTVAIDITAVIGPALAGPLLSTFGTAWVCWLLTFNYLVDIFAFAMMRGLPKIEKKAKWSPWSEIIEGARYIRSNHPVFALLAFAVVYNLFEFPLRYALLPVFASNVLGIGATGYGFLLAASGAGALVGAIIAASLGDFQRKARLCIIVSVAVGIAGGAFSLSPWYPLSLVLIGIVGVFEAMGMITMIATILALTPLEMRGRVMGVRSLCILPLAAGSLTAGAMASWFGAPVAGTINATLQVVFILTIALAVPSLRKSG